MSHALDQVAADKDKLWDVAEQLAEALAALEAEGLLPVNCCDSCRLIGFSARAALAEWKRWTG